MAGVLAAALLSAVTTVTTAEAAAKPDLQVSAVAVSRTSVVRGASVKISDTTENRSGAIAAASVTRYYLSRDKVRDAGDRLLGSRAVARLAVGKVSVGSKVVTIAAATAPRVYKVIACADATSKVRESNESNNCRSLAATLRVTTPPPPVDPGVFPQVPDPLQVTYTVDDERATTELVYDVLGATLTTTGADGTSYRLEIGPNALSDHTEITMTPVLTIGGLPMTRSAGAVEITPHGLLLDAPATLTITPADLPAVAEQTGFLFHDGGADFQMMPLELGAPIAMKLTHFSTPGIGAATPAQRATITDRSPARTEAQLQNEVSSLLGAERRSQLAGGTGDPDLFTKIAKLSNEYFDDVVKPRLTAAETDDRLAFEAIALGLSYLRQVELLGLDDGGRGAGLTERFGRILRNAVDKSYLRCVDQNSVREALNLMVYARINALLGFIDQDQVIFDYQRRCARFEVRFDSRITDQYHADDGSTVSDTNALYDVSAGPFVVALDTPNASRGSGSVGWDDYSYLSTLDRPHPNSDLTTTGSDPQPGTMFATVRMGTNYYLPDPAQLPDQAPPGLDGDLVLSFQDQGTITAPSELYTTSGPSGVTARDTRWMFEFSSNHAPGSYEVTIPIRGLEQDGAQLLRKLWHFSVTGLYGITVEDSSLSLTHAPCLPNAACP